MPYCSKCGNNVNENYRFCSKCGNSLMGSPQSQTDTSVSGKNSIKLIIRGIITLCLSLWLGNIIYGILLQRFAYQHRELLLPITIIFSIVIGLFILWVSKDWRLIIAFPLTLLVVGGGGTLIAYLFFNYLEENHIYPTDNTVIAVVLLISLFFVGLIKSFIELFKILYIFLGATKEDFSNLFSFK